VTRALVTGGAGFVGSHLCNRLLDEGWGVVCLDSMLTGSPDNLSAMDGRDRFAFHHRDVSVDANVEGRFDYVFHLASPASPPDYLMFPLESLRVGSLGTLNCLELARSRGAIFVLASTSEVYGDPRVHPQPESYWGNVNPVGPRAVYDEAKRFAEAVTAAYQRTYGLRVKIVRIFNTFGPRMRRRDGRAVPNFIDQSLKGEPLTVHGDGSQTRSLCFVSDLVDGIFRFATSDVAGVVNLGNPEEITILELARIIRDETGSSSEIVFHDRPIDDPEVRCPDITRARSELSWEPRVTLREGLATTIEWARSAWVSTSHQEGGSGWSGRRS
jgi:nucleoside-diphosphate-sugar epimerase